ncbi:MAG: polysaccharide deacetylase family protein [Vicinamibacteria bacterium]|nr:polysaccharide deacetylase family protein [Vicinamibacteria bacterium]
MSALKRVGDAGRLLLDLVSRDPPFVRGGGLNPHDIPVFTFHSLEPRSFERKMRYLREAGYQAISMNAYLDALSGRAPAPPRSVLITIDDGRASTWTVGHPILKKLGLRATAFLVTSAVHDSTEVSKTIAEVETLEWGPLVARDHAHGRPFVTWGEVRAMRDVIDVGSHTHLHARIPISSITADVMKATMQWGYGVFDCPLIWVNGREIRGREVPLGTPLPESAPRLSGSPAYRSIDDRYETPLEASDAMRFDLGEARRLLQEKAGVDARALCYPWHVHSEEARWIAAEVGYGAGFAGKATSGPAIAKPGADLLTLNRVGEDYVERLPGPGRRSLLSILREKLLRGRHG